MNENLCDVSRGWHFDARFSTLSRDALWLWFAAISFARDNQTDGIVLHTQLIVLCGSPKRATDGVGELLTRGLLLSQGEGAWQIAGFPLAWTKQRINQVRKGSRERQSKKRAMVKVSETQGISGVSHRDTVVTPPLHPAGVPEPTINPPENTQAESAICEVSAQGNLFADTGNSSEGKEGREIGVSSLSSVSLSVSSEERLEEKREKRKEKKQSLGRSPNKNKETKGLLSKDEKVVLPNSEHKMLSDIFHGETTIRKDAHKENLYTDVPESLEEQMTLVFNLWKVLYHPTSAWHVKRMRVIKSAIEAHGFETVRLAVIGCSYSDFHCGLNPSGKKYDWLENYLNKPQTVEQFADYALKASGKPSSRLKTSGATDVRSSYLLTSEDRLEAF